ncbi:MAG TPA: GNAT family N-acetyltransferase [Bacillus sp. (in: firmicutes)]|uniref:GNAT family N-acetyltransferase n=1 Tax=Bacillus litorisediminis TaxID=2922713 RepID=UPI001FAE10B3|nr:GNAT family N-acetyltransferase [Bacillus litorisediminis]HWO76543.1 GNAT family N-acetyltransferase [Bacillus sp. (in: firmicutes)]
MGGKTELIKTVDFFVRGEFYCSRQPATQLHDYDSIKHLTLGTNVDGRTDEFFVYNSNPAHVLDIINKQDFKEDYWLTVFSDEKPYSYDAEGYTLKSTEFLMMLHLDSWSIKTETKIIKRVETEAEARRINHYFDRAAIDLKKLDDPNLHFYVGEENGHPASYGRYLLLDKTVCFLSDVFTSKIQRGKGIAKALCRKMLMDAKQEGAVKSVLASSQMGHPLYLKLGYRDVSKMWVFKKQS